MNTMKHLLSTALALAALSVANSAQSQANAVSLQDTPRHATLNMAKGEITRQGQQQKDCLWLKYENSDYSGYYSIPGPGHEWIDWGIMPDSSTSGDLVGMYCTAYGTSVIDTNFGGPGASMCNMFYDDVMGWCAESGLGLQPTFKACWYGGLPGHPDGTAAWGWIICVMLTGGYEFTQDSGPFGYAMSFFDSSTGPLLMYAGSANLGTGFDSNGQEDAFDIYIPNVATGVCGTYWFGGYPNNFSSWWLEVYVVAGADCTWYCGTGANDTDTDFTVVDTADLGGTFAVSVGHSVGMAGGFLVAYDAQATYPSAWGEILVDIFDADGELSGIPSSFGNPCTIAAGIPDNAAFCGFVFYCQAVCFGTATGLDLTCAAECTVGVCD
jgi:hypothetical protein